MKLVPLLMALLIACQPPQKGKLSITGRWEYQTVEWFSGEPFVLTDSMSNVLHTQQKGIILQFKKNNSFRVTQKDSAGKENFIAEQPFELPPGDTLLRLKNTGRPDDEFSIVGLNDSLLRLNLFHSHLGYLVFRRID